MKILMQKKIEKALYKTLKSGISTVDIGGTASTTEFRDAIIKIYNKIYK